MRIAVLLGGDSPERDVSFDSGKNIAAALSKNGHDVIEFDPGLDTQNLISNLKNELEYKEELKVLENKNGYFSNIHLLNFLNIDLVFNALHGGKGENGILQALLETLGIKYTGSNSLASMLAMDKEVSKMIFVQKGIPTAHSLTIKDPDESADINKMTFPVIVKPADGGSSLGHTVLNNESGLKEAVRFALKYGNKVLIEEFIKGKEIAAGVINGKELPLIHIKPKHDLYDYECKYTSGMSEYIIPADIDPDVTEKIQNDACKVFKIFGMSEYARIDFLVKEDNSYYVLEANTLPGMTSTSLYPKAAKAFGISFEKLIDTIVKKASEKDGTKK